MLCCPGFGWLIPLRVTTMSLDRQTQFDFIIVGAGSAGATLAARLSENPQFTVCLIEAGKKDKSPFIHIPFGLALLAKLPSLNWNYDTAPQPELNNRSLYWPRGKTLGGSSSVNAMCYTRGDKQDYDHWRDLGATGWEWDVVLPYFKKSECQQHGADGFHGDAGPLSVTDLRHVNPLSHSFVAAAGEVGLATNDDFNGPEREGLGFYQVTHINGQRCSSAKGYLTPAYARPNLTVITQALVEKVLIEKHIATGVRLRINKQVVDLSASKEVIISGGTINSPQILMLSGIGPKAHLQALGIDVQADLPGVGEELQDHLDAIVQHRCTTKHSYAVSLGALPRYIKAAFNYWLKRKDIFASNIAEAGGFVKSVHCQGLADIQYHFLPAILQDHGRRTAFGYGYGLHVCNLYPKSRGRIRLQSTDPAHPPLIDPQYLSHEDDQKVMIDGVRQARKILAASVFKQYQSHETLPGSEVQSDEQILAFIRAKAESIYHPVGSCKMGRVEEVDTVVDSNLCVKGVKGLRVVDASVMPTLIGGNTNAATIMIAERAADLIKKQHA
ncbi:MAG: choline dehydrogenase [Paraglaciecola sp.]|jgi:choline dehydrogenase